MNKAEERLIAAERAEYDALSAVDRLVEMNEWHRLYRVYGELCEKLGRKVQTEAAE